MARDFVDGATVIALRWQSELDWIADTEGSGKTGKRGQIAHAKRELLRNVIAHLPPRLTIGELVRAQGHAPSDAGPGGLLTTQGPALRYRRAGLLLLDYFVTPDGGGETSRSFSSLDIGSLGLEPLPGAAGLVAGSLLPMLPPGLLGAPGPWALRMGSLGEDFEVVVSALGLHAESDSAMAATAGSRMNLE